MKCESVLDRIVIRSLFVTIAVSFLAGCLSSAVMRMAALSAQYAGWAVDIISRFLAGHPAKTPH